MVAAAGRQNLLTSNVLRPCTVLIAAPDLLPALKARAEQLGGELLAFTDADALKALELIMKRRPEIVALERLFADTPRGAALIDRIKADPSLAALEIRVVSLETGYARNASQPPADPARAPQRPPGSWSAGALDGRGTRRAPRFRIAGAVDVLVDGNQASLVDLSTVGAQVVSAIVLKPNQRVRVSLYDDHGTVRVRALVAWASFEMPPETGPRYRVGLEFIGADPRAVEAYCLRHKA